MTVIGAYVAPVGTFTDRLVELADKTAACTAPKKTMFDEADGLKLAPDILMPVPTVPEIGMKPLMAGTIWAVVKAGISAARIVRQNDNPRPAGKFKYLFMAAFR